MLLVVDEVYRRLIYPPHRRTEPFHHYEHTVLCRSFSKDLGVAGERIGYLALHPSLTGAESEAGLALCQRALGYVNAPATAQLALLELESWEADASPYRERRDLIAGAAAAAGLEAAECQGGLYLWVRCPWEETLDFVAALAERRAVVVPGVAFGVPDHFRICFSVDRPALAIAARALAETTASRREVGLSPCARRTWTCTPYRAHNARPNARPPAAPPLPVRAAPPSPSRPWPCSR